MSSPLVGQPFLTFNGTSTNGIVFSIEPKPFFLTHTDYVFINSQGGVALSRALYDTNFPSLQFTVVARDSLSTDVECRTDVIMTISRNLYTPVVTPGQQTVNPIDQTTQGCVWTVQARDSDTEPQFGQASLRYYMVGDAVASRYV